MQIEYIKGQLQLSDLSAEDSRHVQQLQLDVRDQLLDWSAGVRTKVFGSGQTIIETFQWEGMSTWWIGRLVQKNSFTSNRWLNQLIIVYICKQLKNGIRIKLITDDIVLYKTALDNASMLNVSITLVQKNNNLVRSTLSILKQISNVVLSLGRDLRNHLLLACVSNTGLRYASVGNVVWFRTLFPINWIGDQADNDRLYGRMPLEDEQHGYKSRYLVYLSRSKKDERVGFRKALSRIKHLQKKSGRPTFFVEKTLTLTDIIGVYWSTYREQRLFKNISRQTDFRDLFRISELDVSRVLLHEWSSIYQGMQQQAKLQAVATSKFLSLLEDGQKVVTYGELFAANRATYFLTKKNQPQTKFIAIQHAMNGRNKLFTYNRPEEFNFEGVGYGVESSPYPDRFFVQGEQYKKILSEFYQADKIRVIGSLKQISTNASDRKKESLASLAGVPGKRLLIAPSVGDEFKVIFKFLAGWQHLHDWDVYLSPHPTSDVTEVKEFQETQCPALKIDYVTELTTYELLEIVDVVLVGYSTIAIEASLFNTVAVRVHDLGELPQFDFDEHTPSFCDKNQFQNWFESQDFEEEKLKLSTDLFNNYFFSNDGKAGERFWVEIVRMDLDDS